MVVLSLVLRFQIVEAILVLLIGGVRIDHYRRHLDLSESKAKPNCQTRIVVDLTPLPIDHLSQVDQQISHVLDRRGRQLHIPKRQRRLVAIVLDRTIMPHQVAGLSRTEVALGLTAVLEVGVPQVVRLTIPNPVVRQAPSPIRHHDRPGLVDRVEAIAAGSQNRLVTARADRANQVRDLPSQVHQGSRAEVSVRVENKSIPFR